MKQERTEKRGGQSACHVHNAMVLQYAVLYLPYNGRQHSLVWEEKANDLDETRE